MKCIRWALVLATSLCIVAESQSQGLLAPGYGYGGPVLKVTKGRHHLRLSLSAGNYYAGPLGYPCPPPIRQVTVLYTQPAIVLEPRPRSLLDVIAEEVASQRLPPEPPPPPQPPMDPGLGGGAPAGVFRPLAPDNRAGAQLPLPAAPPQQPGPKPPPPPKPPEEKLPPPKPEAPPPKPRPPEELPRPPLPEDDPKAENARLVGLGKAAFANGEYGRAAARFRQAVIVAPREPLAHFLLGEALFALGKYVEGVAAIHTGLALQPDWPAVGLRPLQLYGPNIADYPTHLGHLETALANNPNDSALLFLWAHQLWFDGRRDEAHETFDKARRGGADADDINLFLRALPAAPVL